jgi:hypothetical protein
MDVEEFWEKKEKETGSRLLERSAANYKCGFAGLDNPVVGGLLYLMENGFYFENFQSTNFLVNTILKQEFEKVSFHIPLEKITDVYDFFGNKEKVEETFLDKLKHFFSTKPKELNIEYLDDNNEKTVITFTSFIDPVIFCEAYYKLT